MNPATVILLVISGAVTSYFLVKESSRRVDEAIKEYEFAAFLEERIVFAREPLSSIISSYDGGAEMFGRFERKDGEYAGLTDGICYGNYELASANAALLKKYAEKEMDIVKKDHAETKKVKIALPLAASLLVAILIM